MANAHRRHCHGGELVTCELALTQDAKPDFQCYLKLGDVAVLNEPTGLCDLVLG